MLASAFETKILCSASNFFALWCILSVMNLKMWMKKISSTTLIIVAFMFGHAPPELSCWGSSAREAGGWLSCSLCWGGALGSPAGLRAQCRGRCFR